MTERTDSFSTWGTRQTERNEAARRRKRGRIFRRRRTINRRDLGPQSGGDVHQSGVVRDREAGGGNEVDCILEPGSTRQIENFRSASRDLRAYGGVVFRAQQDDSQTDPIETFGQGDPMLRGPSLGRAELGARNEDDKINRGKVELSQQSGSVVGVRGDRRRLQAHGLAENLGFRERLICERGLAPHRRWHQSDVVQKPPASFAEVTRPSRRARGEGNERGFPTAGKNIGRAIAPRERPPQSHPFEEAKFAMRERRDYDPRHLRHSLDEWRNRCRRQDIDRGVRITNPQRLQKALRHDDIADPTGADDENSMGHCPGVGHGRRLDASYARMQVVPHLLRSPIDLSVTAELHENAPNVDRLTGL
jgi:hypothetical protein